MIQALDKRFVKSNMPANPLKQRFTPLQLQKLTKSGFGDLYSFITYLPFDLAHIEPLSNLYDRPKNSELYLFSGKLTDILHKKAKQRFLVLDFEGSFDLKCYLFSVADYVLKTLLVGQTYQLLLSYNSSGFWSLEKFALQKSITNSSHFILGQAQSKSFLLPKYLKNNELRNGDFLQLHRRLESNDYILNLAGLIPDNPIIPTLLDLSKIHKPINKESYLATLNSWISLKVYLRLSLLKYMDKQNQETVAKAGELDMEFLKKLTQKLPFELSNSQKTTIWEILQEITVVKS